MGWLTVQRRSSAPPTEKNPPQPTAPEVKSLLVEAATAYAASYDKYFKKDEHQKLDSSSAPVEAAAVEKVSPGHAAWKDTAGALRPSPVERVGELRVTEKRLAGYVEADVVHVENVLANETRQRVHQSKSTSGKTSSTTDDTESEKISDRQTTTKTEFQHEARKAVEERQGLDISSSVSASYGPVAATVGLNFSSSTSKSEAQREANSFASEVVSRAVSRVRDRQQTVRTSYEELRDTETNTHGFANNTAKNIIGVYRALDKVFDIFQRTYDDRLFYDVTVLNPGEFLRESSQSRLSAHATSPPEPFTIGDSAIKSTDITPSVAVELAVRYALQDLPPVPALQRVDVTFAGDNEYTSKEGRKVNGWSHLVLGEAAVPAGYEAFGAIVTYGGDLGQDDATSAANNRPIRTEWTLDQGADKIYAQHWISVGGSRLNVSLLGGIFGKKFDPRPSGSLAIGASVLCLTGFRIDATVICIPTDAAFVDWQLSTLLAARDGYERLLTKYQQSVADAGATSGVSLSMSDGSAKELIVREMRRLFLSSFAVTGIGPGLAIPDSAIVSFFEQSFEWSNLQYMLYPYYWAPKDNRAALAFAYANNQDLVEFVSAGAARIVVPARRESEADLLRLLAPAPGPAGSIDIPASKIDIADELAQRESGIPSNSAKIGRSRLGTTLARLGDLPIAVDPVDPPP
jgi:hypothetical protein